MSPDEISCSDRTSAPFPSPFSTSDEADAPVTTRPREVMAFVENQEVSTFITSYHKLS